MKKYYFFRNIFCFYNFFSINFWIFIEFKKGHQSWTVACYRKVLKWRNLTRIHALRFFMDELCSIWWSFSWLINITNRTFSANCHYTDGLLIFKYFLHKIANYFNKISFSWEKRSNIKDPLLYDTIQHRNQYVLDLIRKKNTKNFLDVGCGSGELIQMSSNFTSESVGIDF